MKRKIVLAVLLLAVLAAGGYAYYANSRAQPRTVALAAVETVSLAEGDLTMIVSAIGKVRANQSASLAWETSGSVAAVNAAAGDSVKAGETLAALAQTSLPQSVILAQADLVSAEQSLQELATEAESARVKAMQDIVTYEQALRDAQFQSDNFTIPSNMSGMDAVEALAAAKTRLDAARLAFEPYKHLASGNSVRTERLTTLNEAQADYNTAVKRLQYEYDLAVAQANLEKAQADYEKWKNGPLPSDLKAAEARVAAAQATLEQDHLDAPFDGVITLALPRVGDQVSANTTAFRIDDLNALFVDVQVSEIDINQVQAGQPAELAFDAIPDKTYHGSVTQVAMTGEESSNVVNYTVTVRVDDADSSVRPGMTAQVDITTASLENVLLVPNQAIQMENGRTVVFMVQPGGLRRSVPVTLGLADESNTQIIAGEVKSGDAVVLNPTEETEDGQTRMRMGPFGGPPSEGRQRDNSQPSNGGGQP